jgi:iron complex outermembrane receptor protein
MKNPQSMVCGAILALCSPLAVLAQAEPGEDSGAESLVLEEIIVTAQKREESLKDVPMSVSVVGGESIEEFHADTFLDVIDLTVGVDFELADGDEIRSTIVTIRGVGSAQNTTGLQPSSTVMVDGEVLSRTAALSGDLLDVQRVEVLRGPQGTLYGKNASAGVIHTISRRPQLGRFSSEVELLAAEDDEYRVTGMANLSVSDKSALRVNGFYKNFGGFIRNLYPGYPNGGDLESYGVRAQYLIEASETLSIMLRGDTSSREVVNPPWVIVGMEDPDHPIISLTGGRYDRNNDTTTMDPTQYSELNSWGISAEVIKQFGDASLTYLGYYRNWDLWENIDPDRSALRMSELQFGGISESKTMQHELRWTSPAHDRYDYILGAYYYDTDDFRDAGNRRCTRDPAGATLDPDTLQVIHCRRTDPPYNRIDHFTSSIAVQNFALFGNMNIHLTDRWTLILGARAMREKMSLEYEGGRNEIPFFRDSETDEAFTGRFGIQYAISESSMVYGTYSTGWKGRAYLNTGNLAAEEADPETTPFPLDPEEVTNIEFGFRSVLADGRLQLNGTIYSADFEDFQERVRFEDEEGNIIATLRSIPSVLSEGFELESMWQATGNLRLDLAVSYNETTYDVPPGLIYGNCPDSYRGTDRCVTIGRNQLIDLSGETRPNAPEWQYVIGGRWRFKLADTGWGGALSFNYKYTDKTLKGIDQDPLRAIDAQDVANANLALTSPSGRFRWNLFVKNLMDDRLIRARNYNPSNNFGGRIVETLPRNYERYFGVSLRMSF